MYISPEASGSAGPSFVADPGDTPVSPTGGDPLFPPPVPTAGEGTIIPDDIFGPDDTIPPGEAADLDRETTEPPTFEAHIQAGVENTQPVKVIGFRGITDGEPFFTTVTENGVTVPVRGSRLINASTGDTYLEPAAIDVMKNSLGMQAAIENAGRVTAPPDFAHPEAVTPRDLRQAYTALREYYTGLQADLAELGPDALHEGDIDRMAYAERLLMALIHKIANTDPAYSEYTDDQMTELVHREGVHMGAMRDRKRLAVHEMADAEIRYTPTDQSVSPEYKTAATEIVSPEAILRAKERIRIRSREILDAIATPGLSDADRRAIATTAEEEIIDELLATIPRHTSGDQSKIDGLRWQIGQRLRVSDATLIMEARRSESYRKDQAKHHRIEHRREGRDVRRRVTDRLRHPRGRTPVDVFSHDRSIEDVLDPDGRVTITGTARRVGGVALRGIGLGGKGVAKVAKTGYKVGRGTARVGWKGTKLAGRGVAATGRGIGRVGAATGRGVARGARAGGKGVAKVAKTGYKVGRGTARVGWKGTKLVGRGVVATGRGVGRGTKFVGREVFKEVGKEFIDLTGMVGRGIGRVAVRTAIGGKNVGVKAGRGVKNGARFAADNANRLDFRYPDRPEYNPDYYKDNQ